MTGKGGLPRNAIVLSDRLTARLEEASHRLVIGRRMLAEMLLSDALDRLPNVDWAGRPLDNPDGGVGGSET